MNPEHFMYNYSKIWFSTAQEKRSIIWRVGSNTSVPGLPNMSGARITKHVRCPDYQTCPVPGLPNTSVPGLPNTSVPGLPNTSGARIAKHVRFPDYHPIKSIESKGTCEAELVVRVHRSSFHRNGCT